MRGDLHLINELGRRRDLIVHRPELLAAGLSRTRIQTLMEHASIAAVFEGIYVVGAPVINQRQLMQAAMLLGGPGSQLSHRSSAEIRKALRPRLGHVTVTSPRKGVRSPRRTKVPMTDGTHGLVAIRHGSAIELPTFVEGCRPPHWNAPSSTLPPTTASACSAGPGRRPSS